MEAQGSVWKGIRQVKTCTECKQAKLKCDSREKFPGPCTRCQVRQLNCSVDPSFRRMPARKRFEAMSRELEELRQQKRDPGEAGASSASASTPARSQAALDGHSAEGEQKRSAYDLDLDPRVLSLQIGSVVIDRRVAIEAFHIFTTHFHPHLPVVGSISINQVYQSSPFLFWTIIAVVVTRLTTRFEPGLDTRLQEPVRQMVSREALVSPLPLHKIHALLILCTWPLPAESQNQDPSWLYAGVAVNAARYMGLHRASAPPPLRSIGVVSGGLQSRTRTWLVCFYVGNSLAMLSGLPPLISSPPDVGTIRDFMTKFPAPPEFELNVKTNLAIANLTNTLFHSESDVVDSSLIQLLDSELNGLMTRPSERWADFNEIGILSCRLHIYVMVITKSQTAAQTRDILLRLGFAAALRIIHLAVHLTHPTAPLSTNPLADMPPLPADQLYRTYPKGFFRTLAFSTIFLYRFFVLSANAPTEEQQLASKHAAMAQRLFTSCAYKPQDELGRGAALFEALSRAPVVSDDTTKLSRWLSDRMAAAIMLEGMRIGAEVRGMPVHIVEENAEGDTGDALLFADPSDPDDLGLDEMNLSVDDEAWLAEAEAAAEAAAIDYQSHQFWSDAAWNMLSYDFGGTQM